jgi:anti-anti-sigma regulatory factor
MEFRVKPGSNSNCIIFSGPMTCNNSREIENRIISAMRQHPRLDVDLSGVEEIDLCGIHLLGVLKSFGGDAVNIIATSPTVDAALTRLPTTHRHARLKRTISVPAPMARRPALAAI